MKSFVWFELPRALSELAKAVLPASDVEYINVFSERAQALSLLFDEFNLKLMQTGNGMSLEELQGLKQKLGDLNKERVELVCACIKSSIQLIGKLMKYFEKKQSERIDEDTLVQVKLLSKITRVVMNNSALEIKSSKTQREKTFFTMILVYIEKTQTKLYQVSTEMIEKYTKEKQALAVEDPQHKQLEVKEDNGTVVLNEN